MLRVGIFFLLLLAIPLFASDQNSSLTNADKATYISLLKTIKENNVLSDETSLQKILLEKLINTPPQTALSPLTSPENIDAYSQLFSQYIDNALKKDALAKKIQSIEIKIQTLDEEIKSLEKNNPSELTLQLQSALYAKSLKEQKEQSEATATQMLQMEKILTASVINFTYNPEILEKKSQANKNEATKLRSTIDKLLIERERFELLGDKRDRGASLELIDSKKESYQKAVLTTINALFLEFSNALKAKNENAFAIEKKMMDEISNLENARILGNSISSLFHTMEKRHFGTIETIAGSTFQELKNILIVFWGMISEPIFTVNGTHITIFKLIFATFIFISGFVIGGFYKASINKIASTSKSINLATRTILANIGYYLIIITAFFIALNVLGIDLSSMALVAGALSVGIGFGLQNIVSNFVSGIILIFERSIKIGDYVELSDTLRGHVRDIHMRSTTLNTNGNIDVIVPNRNFIEGNVINWTMHDKVKRFDIPFSVAYGTDLQKVIEVITQAVAKSGYEDIMNTPERFTSVIMTGMGSSSLDFALQVWIYGEEILAPKKTSSRFLMLVYNTLVENGIEIPFPQQDLHIKSVDKDICTSIST